MDRKTRLASLLILAVLAIFPGSSQAGPGKTATVAPTRKADLAYIYSRPMLNRLYVLGTMEDRTFGLYQDCTSKYLVRPIGTVILKPLEFSKGKQHPSKGAWLTRYQLERCGAAKIYNALFIANPNGDTPRFRPYFPGSSLASLVLIRDALVSALPMAIAAAGPGSEECQKPLLFDMRVTEPPHEVVEKKKTFKGVWNELWTFSVCGRLVDVAMTFVPDASGGGTTFFAKAKKDRLKP